MNISKTMTMTVCVLTSSLGVLACDADPQPDPVLASVVGLGDASVAIAQQMHASEQASATVQPQAAEPMATAGMSGKGKKVEDADLIGWVRWSGALPYVEGPIFDQTGALCAEGQSGSTWYLPGTPGGAVTRDCTIPLGKQLVFPLVNLTCALGFEDEADNLALIDQIDAFADYVHAHTCELVARLDGQDLYAIDQLDGLYLEVHEPFEVELFDGPDNFADWFGLVGGTVPTIGSGHYAKLPPLTPGDHTLEFGGTICDGDYVLFSTHATYNLHVGL